MSQEFLRRNESNRLVSLRTVKKYFNVMKAGQWYRTGQPLILNKEGKAEDLQHRCWASLLGGVSFPSFIITDSPVEVDKFARIDDGKVRTLADALQTSGLNGLAAPIAAAIKLAWKKNMAHLLLWISELASRDVNPEILAL